MSDSDIWSTTIAGINGPDSHGKFATLRPRQKSHLLIDWYGAPFLACGRAVSDDHSPAFVDGPATCAVCAKLNGDASLAVRRAMDKIDAWQRKQPEWTGG